MDNEKKFLQMIRDTHAARRDFITQTEEQFLAMFRKTIFKKSIIRSAPLFLIISRGIPVLALGIACFAFIAVYADYQDVSPFNIFYPLKRSQEKVTTMLVSKDNEQLLRIKLATRRLNEINTVLAFDENDARVTALISDFNGEVIASLAFVDEPHILTDRESMNISEIQQAEGVRSFGAPESRAVSNGLVEKSELVQPVNLYVANQNSITTCRLLGVLLGRSNELLDRLKSGNNEKYIQQALEEKDLLKSQFSLKCPFI